MKEIDAIIKASDNEFVAELDLEKCKRTMPFAVFFLIIWKFSEI